ncbi:nuclear transport factor 2 family protein [Thalassospira lucentensis]|uniref:nuclear transport factor 2 family protein n=1 Tax=Thalassospira lucentensis TaxID=168935 RepID=UPI00399D6733
MTVLLRMLIAGAVWTTLVPCISHAGEKEMTKIEALEGLYDRFNARDIEGVLEKLADDVTWANGMEDNYVHGHDGVRQYWTYQWSVVSPHVTPVSFHQDANGSITVEVQQVIRDLDGNSDQTHGLEDKTVGHIFSFKNGKVSRFDIRDDR